MTGNNPNGNLEQRETGEFLPKFEDNDFVVVLANAHPEPLTAIEVAERKDTTSVTARNYLSGLVDEGIVKTKKVGGRARVYWVSDDTAEIITSPL